MSASISIQHNDLTMARPSAKDDVRYLPQQAFLPSPPPSASSRTASPERETATVEASQPAESAAADAEEVDSSAKSRRDDRVRQAAVYLALLTGGWGDASSGPLLPFIQAYYGISYTTVSTIFVGTMAGSAIGGVTTDLLSRHFGMGKTIVLGALFQLLAYALLVPTLPSFVALPLLFISSGLGIALQQAQAFAWGATLPQAEKKMSFFGASYGLGAAVSPLAATAFTSAGFVFSRFYAVSLGLAVLNVVGLLYAFRLNFRIDSTDTTEITRNRSPSPSPGQAGDIEPSTPTLPPTAVVTGNDSLHAAEIGAPTSPQIDSPTQQEVKEKKKKWTDSILWRALANRTMPFAALFSLLYVGSEVSMGGWIVTFLQEDRNGGSSSGYVASGYWLGIVIGRLIFIPVTSFLGEQRAVLVYTGVAFCLEFVIWFHNSLISNAVVVGLVGLLMGPSYPISISVITKLLPRRLHPAAIALITCFGQVGSALFPFVVGALAQRYDPGVLNPTMVVLLGGQAAMWFCLPKVERKKE